MGPVNGCYGIAPRAGQGDAISSRPYSCPRGGPCAWCNALHPRFPQESLRTSFSLPACSHESHRRSASMPYLDCGVFSFLSTALILLCASLFGCGDRVLGCMYVCAMADKSDAAEEVGDNRDVYRGFLKWVAAVCS